MRPRAPRRRSPRRAPRWSGRTVRGNEAAALESFLLRKSERGEAISAVQRRLVDELRDRIASRAPPTAAPHDRGARCASRSPSPEVPAPALRVHTPSMVPTAEVSSCTARAVTSSSSSPSQRAVHASSSPASARSDEAVGAPRWSRYGRARCVAARGPRDGNRGWRTPPPRRRSWRRAR